MHKQFKTILLINALLILLFVWTNYGIANDFNSHPSDLLYVHWSFFGWIQISHAGTLINGNYVGIGADDLWPNFPFWLFFVAIAVNMYFIYRLQKSTGTKQTPS